MNPSTESEDDGLLDELAAARPGQTDVVAHLLRATMRRALTGAQDEPFRLGRFTVLELLGRGGMGTVFVAYDPDLDRKIALKVLHNRGERGRREVLREGRALARLKHPGVVTVYEVGVVEDQVFVAMEHVDGVNLRTYLRQKPTSARVLALLLDAGRGLAAAHEAELVHFDVKPENLLVDAAGRGRVIDFGLARSLEDAEGGASGSTSSGRSTVRGGTPEYTAPERARGERGDSRADQYSFCVTCWEALCGQRPRAGEEPPAAAGTAPPRVLRALRRGMSVAPGDRFASMHELLAALEARPARRWLGLAVVLALGLALGGYLVGQRGQGGGPRCSPQGAELAATWDDGRAEAIGAAFIATGVPFARDTWATARPALDRYAAAWIAAQVRACEQTHVVGVASQEMFDRRRLCLADRRLQFAAVLDRFAAADTDAVLHAHEVIDRLQPVEDCEQADLREPLPADPTQAQEFARLRGELARARVELEVGRPETAAPQLERLVARTRAGGNASLLLEALLLAGRLDWLAARYESGLARTREALALALDHGEPAWAALASLQLIDLSRMLRPASPVHEDLLVFADGLARQAGDPPRLRSTLILDRGVELLEAGRCGEAVLQFAQGRAFALAHEFLRDANAALVHTGHCRAELGEYAEAVATNSDALAELEGLVGPMHHSLARIHNNLAADLMAFDRIDEALGHLERTAAITRANFGEDHPTLGKVYNNLGTLETFGRGRHAEALAHFRRAGALFERLYGPKDVRVALTLCGAGLSLLELGRLDEALVEVERADALHAELLAPGDCQRLTGTCLRAEVLVELGRHAEALALLEPALALANAGQCTKDARGDLEVTAARALWALRGDRARARVTALLAEMSDRSSPRSVTRADALRAAMRTSGGP